MGRLSRRGIVVLAAVLLVGGACSGGDGTTGAQAPTSTTSGPEASSVPQTPSEDTTPEAPPAEGEPAEGGEPAVDGGPPPTLDPATPGAQPVVAEAGGWRLVVTFPSTGSTVGRSAGLCYQVTGPSQEADVVLELTVGERAPINAAGSVGQGSAEVELGEADPEPLDLRIQLIVNGQRISGAVVAIPDILIVPAATRPSCA